jgi:hypothetical protein
LTNIFLHLDFVRLILIQFRLQRTKSTLRAILVTTKHYLKVGLKFKALSLVDSFFSTLVQDKRLYNTQDECKIVLDLLLLRQDQMLLLLQHHLLLHPLEEPSYHPLQVG